MNRVLAASLVFVGATLTPVQSEPPARPRGERYALLIGVRQYNKNELRPLPYSEPDVTELAQVLRESGYLPENVVLMTQTRGAENSRFLPLAGNIRREQNRLVERHASVYGAYWKSYDFKPGLARGNLFKFPLGPAFRDNAHPNQAFEHAGGEIIFHLPNGLQGYLLVDNKDNHIDEGPVEIVSDSLKTSGTPAIVNGLSCMACHNHGMRRFKDTVREGLAAGDEARLKVEQIYPKPEVMDKVVKRDEDQFLRALDESVEPFLKVGADERKDVREFREVVSAATERFINKDLGPEEAALELGIKDPKELQAMIKGNPHLRQLGLGPLAQGATIKREEWESLKFLVSPFQEADRHLELGTPLVVQ